MGEQERNLRKRGYLGRRIARDSGDSVFLDTRRVNSDANFRRCLGNSRFSFNGLGWIPGQSEIIVFKL
jgi:hypothetical protein